MRVLVTGATGFVGRWLVRDLERAGHETVRTPPSAELDITDRRAVAGLVAAVRPDAVAHLAGIAYGPDARRDPARALAVNEGGTRALMEGVIANSAFTPVLIASSAEVYGSPDPADLPLRETAPLRAGQPYGLSKVAQERAATELAADHGIPLVVIRAFNHTGPGQRGEFVVPAIAARIVTALGSRSGVIRAGNVDVRRDILDVRDVVRAYRLLLEALAESRLPADHRVYNVASGHAPAIRELIQMLATMAGIAVEVEVDPLLVRPDDPPEIRGDASRIADAVGWRPEIALDTTLRDVLADARLREAAAGTPQA